MTDDLVISAFEACPEFSGEAVCDTCGWLAHEHEPAESVLELQAA
jgi:hypothetical protein